MTHIVKLKSAEQSVTASPNTISEASLVRIVNSGNTELVVTIAGSIDANCTLLANSVMFLQKEPTDTIISSTTCVAASVGFTN